MILFVDSGARPRRLSQNMHVPYRGVAMAGADDEAVPEISLGPWRSTFYSIDENTAPRVDVWVCAVRTAPTLGAVPTP